MAKQTLAEQMQSLPQDKRGAWDRLSDEQAAEIEELLEAHWALPEGKRRSQKAIHGLISNYLPFPVGITTVKQWILDRKPNG